MLSNPLIRRYYYSQFRLQNLLIFCSLYIGIMAIVFVINTSVYKYQTTYKSFQDLCESLFIQFFVLQIIICWLMMPINCSGVIPREIADKSFDFFRMLPLSSTQKAVGILVGRNLFALIAAGINLCLCIFFGIIGQVEGTLLLQLLALTVAGMFVLNFIVLLSSLLSLKKTNSSLLPLIILAFCGISPIISLLITVAKSEKQCPNVFFLNYSIPVLYLVSGYIIVGAVWAFVGILRRFQCEYEPLFSRRGATLFLVNFFFLIYALFHAFLFPSSSTLSLESCFLSSPEYYLSGFSMVSLLPVISIPFLSMRSFDKYIEITHQMKQSNGLVLKLFLQANPIFNLTLFALWTAIVLTIGRVILGTFEMPLVFCTFILAPYVVMITMCEVYVLYKPQAAKLSWLLIFFAGVYLVLPLVLANILDRKSIGWLSPIGLIDFVVKGNCKLADIYGVLIFNIILAMVPIWLIVKKYIHISRLRQTIENKVS